MSIVSEAKVQQWLEATKLTIDNVEDELELSAKNLAFGVVSQAYDTASWVDEATTPSLIQDAMSMFIAAWIYNRAYSEDATNSSSYSSWLLDQANKLLSGISSGGIDLPEIPGTVTTSEPSYFPTNDAVDEFDEPIRAKFSMSSRF